MYKDRFLDKPVQKDILQESFINTMSAWVNMLLMSSTGPIKTPVGACATAVESIDIGYDTIVEGKARVCFVGGFDDFQEEGSYEFANMKATSNAEDEFALTHLPTFEVDVRRRWPSTDKARRLLGWSAQIRLEDGIARTVEVSLVSENPSRCCRVTVTGCSEDPLRSTVSPLACKP